MREPTRKPGCVEGIEEPWLRSLCGGPISAADETMAFPARVVGNF